MRTHGDYTVIVDQHKKTLMLVFLAGGMFLFASFVLFYLEIWAQKQEINVQQSAIEACWDLKTPVSMNNINNQN